MWYNLTMRDSIRHVLQTLLDAGHEAYIVGGYVRDALLGIPTGDCDVATNALPDQVESLFERVATVGKIHGTITVIVQAEAIEVTTYRMDGPYDNHRHPKQVSFASSLSEDLARRDFTINAMAMSIDGTITDLYEGQTDLKQKILRAIGHPSERLQEDALRILRAIRFQSVLGMSMEAELLNAMKQHAGLVAYLSKERILMELRKMLAGDFLELALGTYQQMGFELLPQSLIADTTLTVVEQFAIAAVKESFDAQGWPLRKEESSILKQLLTMSSEVPDDLSLYDMPHLDTMLKVGAHLYQWSYEQCRERYEALPMKHRKELSINGHDVTQMGYAGPEVDRMLRNVEIAILTQGLVNQREVVLAWMKENIL
jgi:tRNA nucleotidyltransferase (CCA-adding enzyme)